MFNTYKRKFEEMERLRKVSNARNFTEGLIIGASLGVALGFLFAPKKGKECREMIYDGARKIGDHVVLTVPKMPKFSCCCGDDWCDDDCCDDEGYCCEDEDCCVGDECLDEYEHDFEEEKEEEVDPTKELENEK